jgi:sialic acid synthase SpsE
MNQFLKNRHPYIIAEIGHAHEGKIEIALELIERCAKNGANAVKFQKRDSKTLYTSSFYNMPYKGDFSFGDTYGLHREFLEPSLEMLTEADKFAHKLGLDFVITPFDLPSLAFCEQHLNIDAYKIASGDLTNHELISAISDCKKPVFSSCGASSLDEIKSAIDLLRQKASSFVMLYTYSEYPLGEDHVFLGSIPYLKNQFQLERIGYSCHSTNIEVTQMAVGLGCDVIEKHICYNKSSKIRDNSHSIYPEEIPLLLLPKALNNSYLGISWENTVSINKSEIDARQKLGKSLYYAEDLPAGTILKREHICLKTPAVGFAPYEMERILGKRLLKNVVKEQLVVMDDCIL